MLGLMSDFPLLLHRIIDHAAKFHGERKVITRSVEGPIVETNYAEIRARSLKVAQRLEKDGIKLGDRVATLAWNTWRHLEMLVRHSRHRRDLPHRQSAAVCRPDHLDRQSCRRPHDVRRSDLRAALGKDRRQAADHREIHRADRRRAHAADHAEKRGRLRRLDGGSRRRFPMAAVRREHRRRHVLHLRHHRQPQGRALFAPLQHAARLHGVAAGFEEPRLERCLHAGGAVLPRQWLVARLLDADGRRDAGAARRQDGRRLDLRTAQHLQGHLHRRGADDLADAAAGPGKDRRQAALPQARGDRRLGLPARHDQDLPGALRRRGRACLGHDRDEPARLALHHEAGIQGPRPATRGSTCR